MKFRYLIFLIVFSAVLLHGCDKVSGPYVEKVDYCSGDKKVLLEDYTGHECVNCPGAALLAHQLQENFCNRVVIMSVHAGFFARPSTSNPLFANDFRTEAGNAWDTFFGNGVQGNPNGLVNRVPINNNFVVTPGNWGTAIAPLLQQPAKASMILKNTFDHTNTKLTTKITTTFLDAVEGDINLLVCLTQDSIIAPQRNNTPEAGDMPINENYVHMHMLRKAMNGTWGESINGGSTIGKNDEFTKEYKLDFVDEWVPKNCHIVAFIYFEDTKEVIQVEEAAVIEE
jgi:hypothetical protein